jgi:hypothetical protein
MITANADFHVRLGPTKRTLTASDKWSKSFETRLEYCYDQPNVRSFESDGPSRIVKTPSRPNSAFGSEVALCRDLYRDIDAALLSTGDPVAIR